MALNNLEQEGTELVTFMSYNCTGMNTIKTQWINEICDKNNMDY